MTPAGESAWYVVHTKRNQEERAVFNLNVAGIQSFSPQLPHPAHPRIPLFPGYVFAHFNVDQQLRLVQFARSVLYVVAFSGIPAPVDDQTIALIQTRSSNTDPYQPHSWRRGDEAIVRNGPLRNMIGIYERELSGRERVHILLGNIAFSARLEVSADDVQPYASAARCKLKSKSM